MLNAVSSGLTGLAALLAVLGLMWIAARGARAAGLGRASSRTHQLALEDQIALDTRRRLLLVRCAGRRVLLLTGGASDVVIGWLGDEH